MNPKPTNHQPTATPITNQQQENPVMIENPYTQKVKK